MINKVVGRRKTSFLSLPVCPKETSSVPCEVKGKFPFAFSPRTFGHHHRRKRQQPLFCTDNRKTSSSSNLCSSLLNLFPPQLTDFLSRSVATMPSLFAADKNFRLRKDCSQRNQDSNCHTPLTLLTGNFKPR